MSQSGAASTARQEPSLIDMISISPCCISTIVWLTTPPSNTLAAPCVRLTSPDAIAASWSARSRRETRRGRERQAVGRDDDGVGDTWHRTDEVGDQPVDSACRVAQIVHAPSSLFSWVRC